MPGGRQPQPAAPPALARSRYVLMTLAIVCLKGGKTACKAAHGLTALYPFDIIVTI